MKKIALVSVLIATLAVALFVTGSVSAQGNTTRNQTTGGNGYGRGMMGGQTAQGEGILHDAMITVYAEKLGISVDDLNARLANGETIAQVAVSKGLTTEQFTTLMSEARSTSLDQAVKAGTLTQAQADWMKQRGAGMTGAGRGNGSGMGRGMRGNGTGDPTTCPYFNQPAQ